MCNQITLKASVDEVASHFKAPSETDEREHR